MIEEGEDVKRVQERLRHASVATTLDLYVHLSDDSQKGVSDRLDAALKRQRKDPAESA
jgi:integrase